MKIRKVDANNDWTFGKGLNSYAIDEAAVEQNVKCRLQSWKGDCFFALQDGVDWQNRLGPGQQAGLPEEIKSVALGGQGVVSVDTATAVFDPVKRAFTGKLEMETIFSPSFTTRIAQASGQGS